MCVCVRVRVCVCVFVCLESSVSKIRGKWLDEWSGVRMRERARRSTADSTVSDERGAFVFNGMQVVTGMF